jgi:hypothetical protein
VGSTLVIEELTGKKRKLELRRGGLPRQGAEWGGENRTPTEFFPGNPEGAQQVLGPTELPSEWEGFWRTTQLLRAKCVLDSVDINYAFTLADLFDEIRKTGPLLRVTWANEIQQTISTTGTLVQGREWKVVRIGRLASFKFKPVRMDDIGWSARFTWLGRGDTQQPAAGIGTDMFGMTNMLNSLSSNLRSMVAKMRMVDADGLVKVPSAFSLGQLEALVNAPNKMMNQLARVEVGFTSKLQQITRILQTARELPETIAARAQDIVNDSAGTLEAFCDELSRLSPEAMTAGQKQGSILRAAVGYGAVQSVAEVYAGACHEFAMKLRRVRSTDGRAEHSNSGGSSATQSDLLAVILPKQGQTISGIAIKYYGEDLGMQLCRANHLPLDTVEPPTRKPLIIPRKEVLLKVSI